MRPTRPATPPASTTAPARSSSPPRSGPRRRARLRWPGSSPTAPSPMTSPTWRKRRPTPPSRRWRRSARAPRRSTSGRSTRPSPRSPSTACGCSASTRRRSTSTAARSWSRSTGADPALSEQPASETAPRAAAFFDLDKTLMAGSSGMQFARIAAKQGIVGKRQLTSWGWEHLRYRLRGTTDERTSEVLKVARELIRGLPAKTIDRMGPEVMAAILPRVFPQMLEEVYAHQDAGRPTFIVSAAGNGVVEQLAHVLGMDGGIGTRYEVDADGNYSGRLDGPFVYGEGKVTAMEEFAERHGIELAESYAYSDSLSDLPMLRAVGNPVAVNPDPPLAAIAREEGWQVLRFERLGRRLVALAVTFLATVAGFGATRVAARRRVPPPRRLRPR